VKQEPIFIASSLTTLRVEELAEALNRRIRDDFGGNVSAAAREAGVSQPTLYRYTHPTRVKHSDGGLTFAKATPDVAKKLAAFLPVDVRPGLFRSPGAAYSLYLYTEWLGYRLDRSGSKGLPHEKRGPRQSPRGVWGGRQVEFIDLLRRIRRHVPTVKADIKRLALRIRKIDSETADALGALGISSPSDRAPD
jgi:hypothetical protein